MVILKRAVRVSLLEELLFEQRVKSGGRVSFADMGGRVVQMERAAGATPSDGAAGSFRSKEAMWLEWKEKGESSSHV